MNAVPSKPYLASEREMQSIVLSETGAGQGQGGGGGEGKGGEAHQLTPVNCTVAPL